MLILKRTIIILFFTTYMPYANLQAMEQSAMPNDPYAFIRYSQAFDQEKLYHKHHGLMKHIGCASNVLQEPQEELTSSESSSQEYVIIEMQDDNDELHIFQQECLNQLEYARKYALAWPGINAVAEMGAMAVGAAAAIKLFGGDSTGGSFAGFVAIFDSLRLMKGAIQSANNLIFRPDNVLEIYEDYFAKNKCFIPRDLWPKIIRELMSARQNPYSRENHTNFLNFALGFSLFKPKPIFEQSESIDNVKATLQQRIDTFFDQYESADKAKELQYITLNVHKFIDQLFENNAENSPRYICLHGPGGIGKTYFVSLLSQWLEELLPGSVNFENVIINDAQELEGTPERPGAILKVLHKQLQQSKRGSVVLFDEATWLNEPGMQPAAKRTFNLTQAQELCTSYFGDGPEGSGIKLQTPPMLIFVANNEPITDNALASRFDIIDYPMPSKNALMQHACSIIARSKVVQRSQSNMKSSMVEQWIDTLEKSKLNFRFVAGAIEVEYLTGT